IFPTKLNSLSLSPFSSSLAFKPVWSPLRALNYDYTLSDNHAWSNYYSSLDEQYSVLREHP
ncbi:hypothetical protein ISN44_As06g020640, partial [Arabidopsis suecica]